VSIQGANPNLRWETTTEFNIGIDFGFFAQKLQGSFDYFTRETRDILITPPVASAAGEGVLRTLNGANVENKGWELAQIGWGLLLLKIIIKPFQEQTLP
jgi:outer membrane receptor protein involved in Fe transport